MSELINNMSGAAVVGMASKLDSEIKAVLDAFWPSWTMQDVKERCVIVSYHGDAYKTLCADGVPLLEIYPPEFRHERLDDRYVVHITQNFRRLLPSAREP